MEVTAFMSYHADDLIYALSVRLRLDGCATQGKVLRAHIISVANAADMKYDKISKQYVSEEDRYTCSRMERQSLTTVGSAIRSSRRSTSAWAPCHSVHRHRASCRSQNWPGARAL